MFGFNKKITQIDNGVIKKKFKIEGMHCSSCAISIDGDLEDLDGVLSSKTNYAKAVTEVEFDPKKVSEKDIIEVTKKLGYRALPVIS